MTDVTRILNTIERGDAGVFINGKQRRIKRPPTIEGMDAEEFIRRNADPIWLHQNELWEYIDQNEDEDDALDEM